MHLLPWLAVAGDGYESMAVVTILVGTALAISYLVFPFVVMSRLKEMRAEAIRTNLWLERLDWHLSQVHGKPIPDDLIQPELSGTERLIEAPEDNGIKDGDPA